MTLPVNACGLHIHEGTTCRSESGIGGKYWVDTHAPVNPWDATVASAFGYAPFYAKHDGKEWGDFAVKTGATSPDIAGKALIVYDATGTAIACALMEQSSYTHDYNYDSDDDDDDDDDDK